MYANPLLAKIPNYDFTAFLKALKVQDRDESLKWTTLIDTYNEKLQILQERLVMKPQNELINYLYREQSQNSNIQYQKDLIEMKMEKEQKQHNKKIQNLKEEIQFEKEQLKALEGFQPEKYIVLQRKSELVQGVSSDNVLALNIKCEDKYVISIQLFNQVQGYKSTYFELPSQCACLGISNQILDQIYLAYIMNQELYFVEVNEQQNELKSVDLYKLSLSQYIDVIYVIDENNILIINSKKGSIYIIQNRIEKQIYQAQCPIKETQYQNQTLTILHDNQIVILDSLPRSSQISISQGQSQYTSIIMHNANLQNVQIKSQLPLFKVEDFIVYVQDNSIKAYNEHKEQDSMAKLQIQFQPYLMKYLAGIKKLIFCDSSGQTYFIDKIVNYFNQC